MSKKSRSEGNRVAMLIKANKAEYYVSDVDLGDNLEDVCNSITSVEKTLGKVKSNFLLISAGIDKLIVAVKLVDSSKFTANDWLESSLTNVTKTIVCHNDLFATCITELETPFKYKDIVRSNAFSYLRKMNLLEEEESEEEYFEM